MIGKPSELDGSTTRVCPGKAASSVLISEDDLRETVSVGRNRAAAAKEPAAQVWFEPFNSTADHGRMADGRRQAVCDHPALADRRQADRDEQGPAARPRPMLVVTRLPPGAVCHVAYVDVAANPERQ